VTIERIWYADTDRDGYGDPHNITVACQQPPNNAENGDDCDDTDPDRYPGATALPDGNDNDCDGVNDKVDQYIDFPVIGDLKEDAGSLQLQAEATSGLIVSYEVIKGNVSVTGNMLSVDGPGEVTISATQEGNEGYYSADPVSQTFCVNPSKPVISLVQDITGDPLLVSNAVNGNRWYYEGTLLPESTNDTLQPDQTGNYAVRTEINQCTGALSELVYVELTGFRDQFASMIRVYPNPTAGLVIFEFPEEMHYSNLRISILDVSSRYIHRFKEVESVMGRWKIDLGDLDPGLYHYVLVDHDRGRQYRGQLIVR
jgi:hypothetical protein